MITPSNGNPFRVTGHLCGKFTGDRWIPRTKASDAELWFFSLICSWWINDWVSSGEAGDLRRHRAHYGVTVMNFCWLDDAIEIDRRDRAKSGDISNINTMKSRQNGRLFQTTFSNAFSWIKMCEFRLRFHWSLFLRIQLTILQHSVSSDNGLAPWTSDG